MSAPEARHYETAAWETGRAAGVAQYSKLHIWNEQNTRMLCGVRPNWLSGNFGSSHFGRCARCFGIAGARNLIVDGQED